MLRPAGLIAVLGLLAVPLAAAPRVVAADVDGVVHPITVEIIARAIEQAFGRVPVYSREGGSIPIVTKFHEALHADVLLLGWGQDDDNAHSPNEKFSLADYHRGIKASAQLWEELGKIA